MRKDQATFIIVQHKTFSSKMKAFMIREPPQPSIFLIKKSLNQYLNSRRRHEIEFKEMKPFPD